MAWVSDIWLLQEPDHRTQPAEFRHWHRESGCWCWWWCTGHFWPSSISFVNLFSHCSTFFWRKFCLVEKSSCCAAVKAVLVKIIDMYEWCRTWLMLSSWERDTHTESRETETEKTKKVESRERGMGSTYRQCRRCWNRCPVCRRWTQRTLQRQRHRSPCERHSAHTSHWRHQAPSPGAHQPHRRCPQSPLSLHSARTGVPSPLPAPQLHRLSLQLCPPA